MKSLYLSADQNIAKVSPNGSVLGNVDKWEAHRSGILHKAFSVCLFVDTLLIMQIRKHSVFDKAIDVTASSHPLYIHNKLQSEEEAVYHCLHREWGIEKKEIMGLKNAGSIYYKAKDAAGFTEHEYCTFYTASIERMPTCNKEFAYGYIAIDVHALTLNTSLFPSLAPWVVNGLHLITL